MRICRASTVHLSGYRLGLWKTGFEDGQHEWRANVNPSRPTGEVRVVTTGQLVDTWGDETAASRLPPLPLPVSATREYMQTLAQRCALALSEASAAEPSEAIAAATDTAAIAAQPSSGEAAADADAEAGGATVAASLYPLLDLALSLIHI